MAAHNMSDKTMMAQKSSSSSLTYDLLAAVDDGDLVNVTKLLKTPGLSINSTNKHGESPLHIAAGYGRLNIVKLLRKHGASLDIRDKQGDTPLYWAARHGHLDVVQYLCEMGAASVQDSTGETALHVSARYGHPEVLAHLCSVGLELDIADSDGDTPLLCGCWHGYQHVVECLVKAGCSLHVTNKEGETALHIAAVRGYYNIVRLLCESGANLDKQDNTGCTALHLATRRNHLDIVQYLCERGCNLNIQDNNGDTALHDACREGQLSIFYTIYAAKCNLDIPNRNGATPLHLAAKYGHMELVRHLCLAGCDVNASTEHGFTADEVAANSSHDRLATFIHHLRQDGLRDHYVRELMLGQIPMGRAKLLVCGAAGVGKTELIDSLKCHLLRSLFRKRSASNLAQMILKRTHGMNIQQVTIPNEGEFSIWDFSGLKEYYTSHEHFLNTKNAIILLVFSLREPVKKQIAQVRFWLAMIKSKQSPSEKIRFAGENPHKPHVILVGSFVDEQLPTTGAAAGGSSQPDEPEDVFAVPFASSILEPAPLVEPDNGRTVLKVLVEEFGDQFVFLEKVYTLDCRLSQTREMKLLRQQLGELRREVIKHQSWNPLIVRTLSQALVTWRKDHSVFPVLTWGLFHRKTQELINPLVSEDRMKIATSALHDMGEVVYINEGALYNIVILDPSWLGLMIIGPALSPENSVVSQLKSVTGRIKMSALQRVYPDWDATSILHLFEHFQLCTPLLDEAQPTYLFPCLIKMQPLFGLWVKDSNFVVYAGVHLKCRGAADIFTPGCFPRIQVQARKSFSDDIDNQELTLWSNGFKCCRGEVEVYVEQRESNKTIEILVRGTEDTRVECHALLQQFYNITMETIRTTNPGTHFATHMLSSKRLREHKEPVAYSAVEIFEAERGDGRLRHMELPGVEESILDAVCCGCEELLIAAKSAPYASIRDVPLQTRVELCRMLDPREPLGRDWCLLALQLGMTEEVPEIDQINDNSSPTDKLLTIWEKCVSSTVVSVIDALRGIGREDCAQVLIEGLSLFSNATSSIVINVPGIALTSYVC